MALLNVSFFSEVLGKQTQMNVILPQRTSGLIGMNNNNSSKQSYKVLYLLHGMSDDYTIWERRTSIERYAHEKDIAIVMPDGDLSWYTDMKYGGKYFTFISKELPHICHDFFPKLSRRREDNFIAGLSMGGYGAFKVAMRCPDAYSKCASLSGALDFRSFLSNKQSDYVTSIVGDLDADYNLGENDLFEIAERLLDSNKPLPELYMWCGTEDELYHDNLKFKKHVKKLGFNVVYTESEGNHDWLYWDREIKKVVDWLVPCLDD